MKIINIILSALILVAAVVSAVFSYFLYEKRVTFVNGWELMSSAIHETAVNLDKNSGTKVAADLTADKLSHKNFDESDMSVKLGKLRSHGKNIIAQRDAFADALKAIASRTNSGAVADISDLNKYNDDVQKVVTGVNKTVRNRDSVYNNLTRIVPEINKSDLLNASSDALNPIEELKRAKAVYRNAFNKVGRTVSVQNRDDKSINRDANLAVNAINALKREPAQLKQQLAARNREISGLKRGISQRDNTISSQKSEIDKLNAQIKKYKQTLGLEPNDPFVMWFDGSEEARASLIGEVTKVSNEYGYIVVNLGSHSVVSQNAGNKENIVKLNLKSGIVLKVVRGDDNEFVAEITLDKVGENESTANIPLNKSNNIEVGDKVIYKSAK